MSSTVRPEVAVFFQKVSLVFCILAALIVVTSKTAAAVDLPPGASLVPPAEWPDLPPKGKGFVRFSLDGVPGGIWGCVKFMQLRPGSNIICNYLDIFPTPQGRPTPPNRVWACVKDENILIYSMPFNKGHCSFVSSKNFPGNAFIPTAAQYAAARQEMYDHLANMLGLAPVDLTTVGSKPLAREETIALLEQLSSKLKTQAAPFSSISALCGATKIALCSLAGSLISVPLNLMAWDIDRHVAAAKAAVVEAPPPEEVSSSAVPTYTEIAVPLVRTLPEQPIAPDPGVGLTEELAAALNQYLTAMQQVIALEEAAVASLERAESAELAGDWYWELRQLTFARQHLVQAAARFAELPAVLAQMEAAFTAAGVSAEFSQQDLLDHQEDVRVNGLSPMVARMLGDLGADATALDRIRMDTLLVNSSGAAELGAVDSSSPGRFPQMLTDARVTQTYQDLAQVLGEGVTYSGGWVYLPQAIR